MPRRHFYFCCQRRWIDNRLKGSVNPIVLRPEKCHRRVQCNDLRKLFLGTLDISHSIRPRIKIQGLLIFFLFPTSDWLTFGLNFGALSSKLQSYQPKITCCFSTITTSAAARYGWWVQRAGKLVSLKLRERRAKIQTKRFLSQRLDRHKIRRLCL